MINLYQLSLHDHRRAAAKKLIKNERIYNLLTDKNSSYAKQMKALQDLHKQVYEIYRNAPDEIQED